MFSPYTSLIGTTMTYSSVAVIGTAGRKDDYPKLTDVSFKRMVAGVSTIMNYYGINFDTVKLSSGGAAWADHVVVALAVAGAIPCKNLTIFAPTPFNGFVYTGIGALSKSTANTTNYHHDRFSQKLGYNSLMQIASVQSQGANVLPGDGNFFARNSDVANSVSDNGVLIAFTFGSDSCSHNEWAVNKFSSQVKADDAGLKPGGTQDTWNKCKANLKLHVRLGVM